jgi:hypothetical protein
MVAEILREGFARAHRRLGLVFLDVVWKTLWLALTVGGVTIVVYRFVSHFEFRAMNIRMLDAIRFANGVREMWSNYGGELMGGLVAVAGLSALLYLLLEAKVRRKLVGSGFNPRSSSSNKSSVDLQRGLKPEPTSVILFLGSNVAKLIILGSAAVTLTVMSNGSRDARIAAVVAFLALAFFATVIDTLVRSDAIELLGVDLFGVTGLIGTLVLFESLIGASLLVVVIAGFLNVANAAGALAMLAVTTLVLLIFNFLHSYLLVVRFSAVGIMRRNVIDV